MKQSILRSPVVRNIFALFIVVFLATTSSQTTWARGKHAASSDTSTEVPLLEGLFALDFPITTNNKKAQAYFNQALVLTYGFDHADAEISFMEAARHDAECAMAYWGVAFVLGPNINAPMNDANVPRAYAMAQKALALAGKVTAKERALIEALAVRYAPEPMPDRSSLDKAFSEAMREVYQRYPDDPNVAVFYAESLMDLHPWNYWADDGNPQPWEPEIETILTKVTKNHPGHPHGHHLYIHLLENSPRPEDTVKSADLIRNLAPASGHLVHMAGHAYYAAGLYHDCSTINEEAIGVDKILRASFAGSGLYQAAYMPHNIHFLLASYMMEGRSQEAVAAARTLAAGIDQKEMRQPGMGALQLYFLAPYYALVRFGRWDEILAEKAPAEDLKYPFGMWHYARGFSYVRKGDVARAEKEFTKLKVLAADPAVAEVKVWDLNSASAILSIAVEVLTGEISAAHGKTDAALTHFKRGVALEEKLLFDEPPTWYYPVRQSLGALLLDLDRIEEAEAVFRKDLLKNAENPWSLYGLTQCLKIKGATALAADAEKRFRRAWARADLELDRPVL
ncbi:MAG: hypothetical protein ABFS18_12700 [Thermodesulfobacteriota bacterium]